MRTPSQSQTLAELRRNAGLTQQEIATRLGVSYKTVSAWETGDARLTKQRAKELADILQVPLAQVISNQPNDMIPFYNMVHAGPMFDPGDNQLAPSVVERRGFTKHPRAFVLRAVGDSMEPEIFSSGTDLYCEPLEDEEDVARLVDGRDVVVTIESEQGTSRQVGKWKWIDTTTFQLVKANPKYEPQTFPLSRDVVSRIAIVVASCRDHRSV